MKLTSRGFTLVELMIVIAIIGILAAALFPSMTGYLKRSRDAARTSGLKDVATALGAYYSDNERYPARAATPCFGTDTVVFSGNTNYFPKGMPTDPTKSRSPSGINGCAWDFYGYNTGTVGGNSTAFQIGATMENANGGNTGSAIGSGLSIANYTQDLGIKKGAGSGYILGN